MLVPGMATSGAPPGHAWASRPTCGAYLAVVLACGLGVLLLVSGGSPPTSPSPDWLRPVPPALVRHPAPDPPAPPGTTDPFTQAFDEAIGPWQAGNYADAALRLEVLARRFPDDADAHFYLGTAWLLAGVTPDAVAPLRRAVALAPRSLAAEASWYLGLALHDLGRHDDARRAFAEACRGRHPHACRALTQRRAMR